MALGADRGHGGRIMRLGSAMLPPPSGFLPVSRKTGQRAVSAYGTRAYSFAVFAAPRQGRERSPGETWEGGDVRPDNEYNETKVNTLLALYDLPPPIWVTDIKDISAYRSGVYIMVREDDGRTLVVYVGTTNKFSSRMRQHRLTGLLDDSVKIGLVKCQGVKRKCLEYALIGLLSPLYNKVNGYMPTERRGDYDMYPVSEWQKLGA